MNRNTLLTRLENSMLVIAKGMHKDTMGFSEYSPALKHVLMVVGSQEMGIKQLAENLRVTSGAATQHVDALVKAGLLRREISSNDRREVVVKTTPKGKAVLQELRRSKTKMLNEVFSKLNDDELKVLVELIEKVSRQYEENKKEVYEAIR